MFQLCYLLDQLNWCFLSLLSRNNNKQQWTMGHDTDGRKHQMTMNANEQQDITGMEDDNRWEGRIGWPEEWESHQVCSLSLPPPVPTHPMPNYRRINPRPLWAPTHRVGMRDNNGSHHHHHSNHCQPPSLLPPNLTWPELWASTANTYRPKDAIVWAYVSLIIVVFINLLTSFLLDSVPLCQCMADDPNLNHHHLPTTSLLSKRCRMGPGPLDKLTRAIRQGHRNSCQVDMGKWVEQNDGTTGWQQGDDNARDNKSGDNRTRDNEPKDETRVRGSEDHNTRPTTLARKCAQYGYSKSNVMRGRRMGQWQCKVGDDKDRTTGMRGWGDWQQGETRADRQTARARGQNGMENDRDEGQGLTGMGNDTYSPADDRTTIVDDPSPHDTLHAPCARCFFVLFYVLVTASSHSYEELIL